MNEINSSQLKSISGGYYYDLYEGDILYCDLNYCYGKDGSSIYSNYNYNGKSTNPASAVTSFCLLTAGLFLLGSII